jgi:tetratricopeptide (TPR) repeat protein
LYDASLKVLNKALSLKPDDIGVSLNYGMILVGIKKYKEGENVFRRILTIHPEEQYFHSFLALTQYYQDNISGAANEIQLGLKSEVYRPFSHAVLGMIYAKQGKLDDSLGEVEIEVKPYVGNNGSLASAVAAIYALLKRDGQAVQWIEKAMQFGYHEYPWVMNDPNFKNLRDDDRFVQLMEKMKENWKKNMELYNVGGTA